jgi:hypothetical protein
MIIYSNPRWLHIKQSINALSKIEFMLEGQGNLPQYKLEQPLIFGQDS